MATCQTTLRKHNQLARQDKRALSSLAFRQLVMLIVISNYDGDTLTVRGCYFFYYLLLFNILFYLQLFWLRMEKPRTKYG